MERFFILPLDHQYYLCVSFNTEILIFQSFNMFPLFVVYMLMQKVIGMSKISKSSSYGSKAEAKKDN